VGTSSSIFIASPVLLFLGQKRLRLALVPATEAVPARRTSAQKEQAQVLYFPGEGARATAASVVSSRNVSVSCR
jgi:hypothetical protein